MFAVTTNLEDDSGGDEELFHSRIDKKCIFHVFYLSVKTTDYTI